MGNFYEKFEIFSLFLFSFLLIMNPIIAYSKNGVYQGYELYKDCKASRTMIRDHSMPNFKNFEQIQAYLISATTCSSYIDAVFDIAVFDTNLIENKNRSSIGKI